MTIDNRGNACNRFKARATIGKRGKRKVTLGVDHLTFKERRFILEKTSILVQLAHEHSRKKISRTFSEPHATGGKKHHAYTSQ